MRVCHYCLQVFGEFVGLVPIAFIVDFDVLTCSLGVES